MRIIKKIFLMNFLLHFSAFAQNADFSEMAYKQLRDSYTLIYNLNLLPGKDYKVICPDSFQIERVGSKNILMDGYACDSKDVLLNITKQAFNSKIEKVYIWSKSSLNLKSNYVLKEHSGRKIVNIDWIVESNFLPSSRVKLSWLNGKFANFNLLRMLDWAGVSIEIDRDYKQIKLAPSNGGTANSLDVLSRVMVMLARIVKGCNMDNNTKNLFISAFKEHLLLKIGDVNSDDDKEVVNFIKNEKLFLSFLDYAVGMVDANSDFCLNKPETTAKLLVSLL